MKNILKKAYDPEAFRKEGHILVDYIADYLQTCINQEDFQVLPWREANEQLKDWKAFFNEEANIQAIHKKFLDQNNHLHHPKYIGHQVVPPLPIAALSELMSTFANNGMAIYEMGPASTAIERIVIEWLLGFLGWDENANGLLTSGGSLGNLTGLLAARQAVKEYDVWETGVQRDLAVMVSAESHYSVDRAVKIMGLGENGVIKLPTKNHKIKTDALLGLLKGAKENGRKVIAVVGNVCSTSTGIYDPIDEMADFCRENNIWFHVDGAHGGPAMISEKYKHLTKGMEKADSIVIDFHKMMLTPALTTAVLFKNGQKSYEAFAQKAAYLLDEKGEIPWYDAAGRTIECTKKAMGLKIYVMMKTYGNELFSAYLEKTYDLGQEFGEYLKTLDDFELATNPESNIVCFRYLKNGEDLNQLNKTIRKKLLHDGEYYIVQTQIDGKIYLRTTIMNPFTNMEVLKELIEKIRTI